MYPKIVSTVGLVCDITGAILVANEVVRVYRGYISYGIDGRWVDMGKPKPEYIEFEKVKRVWMGVGLAFLLTGFFLQIIGIWMK